MISRCVYFLFYQFLVSHFSLFMSPFHSSAENILRQSSWYLNTNTIVHSLDSYLHVNLSSMASRMSSSSDQDIFNLFSLIILLLAVISWGRSELYVCCKCSVFISRSTNFLYRKKWLFDLLNYIYCFLMQHLILQYSLRSKL